MSIFDFDMTKEQIHKGMKEMDVYVPVSQIEKELNMPVTTLQKVLKGERGLPKKWRKPLENYLLTQKRPQD